MVRTFDLSGVVKSANKEVQNEEQHRRDLFRCRRASQTPAHVVYDYD